MVWGCVMVEEAAPPTRRLLRSGSYLLTTSPAPVRSSSDSSGPRAFLDATDGMRRAGRRLRTKQAKCVEWRKQLDTLEATIIKERPAGRHQGDGG